MNKLQKTIDIILNRQRNLLADETWESRRRYFNQMLALAEKIHIETPCQKLYDAFVLDDNGSKERHSLHIRCCRLIDAVAKTNAKDEHGIFYNEDSLPDEAESTIYFQNRSFPLSEPTELRYLIVKAKVELRSIGLTESTIGQYRHSWIDIIRFCRNRGTFDYHETLIYEYIEDINILHVSCSMKEWKWKINRKAAHVLLEIAATGQFRWKSISKNLSFADKGIETIRQQYLTKMKNKNLGKSTMDLHDYVLRKFVEFNAIQDAGELYRVQPNHVQNAIWRFSSTCNSRSLSTILPILRAILQEFYSKDWIEKSLSGVIMKVYSQKGNVASYLSESDEEKLLLYLNQESKRNKAIMLLALRTGLRDCDISNLTFSEIDWANDKIRLIQNKTGEPLVLPLLADVGNAIMDYILYDRPLRKDGYPYIFLRKQAPHNKLSCVYPISVGILNRIDAKPVNGTSKGVHLFRYTLVHRLLKAKVPHQVITDILGHTSKESDKSYISMDESMLKLCPLDLSIIGNITWR